MSEPVELDEGARDLILAGRDGVAPNDFVAERLRRAVDRELRGIAPARSKRRLTPLLVAFGAAALGGALYAGQLALKQESDASTKPAPTVDAAARPPAVVTPVEAPAPAPAPPAVVTAQPSPGQSPSTSRGEPPRASRSQQLGAEIELLARVNAAVNAGDGTRALTLLEEYDRKFRPSILAEERGAASVLALCAAGRTGEARAAAERFSRRAPRSPLLGRIAGSCAGKP